MNSTPTPRHDGWTPERQRVFLEKLAQCGSVPHAAAAAGLSASSAYRARVRPGMRAFYLGWDAALDVAADMFEQIALERAFNGVAQPVFYKGEVVGERIVYDGALTLHMLRRIEERRHANRDSLAFSKKHASAHGYNPVRVTAHLDVQTKFARALEAIDKTERARPAPPPPLSPRGVNFENFGPPGNGVHTPPNGAAQRV